ncbi:MAG: archaeosortase/exosortase family protein [Gammaproteobacteria bacterium]|nr:archaeosortase/exosortase family protein [Gammaproteobacteria bacterium]
MSYQATGLGRNLAVYTSLFFGLFLVMQAIYQGARDTQAAHFLINDMTVMPSALIISWITPDEGVSAQGHRLVSRHVRMSVLNGCEGTEVILLLGAALFALRMGWRRKLLGIVAGSLLVYTANQLRIVSLYYSLRIDHSLFEALHGYIAPLAVVTVAMLFFLYWISHAGPDHTH